MDGIASLYDAERRQLGARRGWTLQAKPFRVTFHPYAGHHGRVWDRRSHYEVRLSELLRDAPAEVHASLARILIGKVDRRLPTTPADAQPFRLWVRRPENEARGHAARRARGHKRMDSPQGRVHDLAPLFHRLNRQFFQGRLAMPRLGWTRRPIRSLYGHQDPAHHAIVINRLLDHPRVPEPVVASILHHEMLHVVHGVKVSAAGRRILHSRAFRMDETRFPHHAASKSFLRSIETGKIRLRPHGPDESRPRTSWASLIPFLSLRP